MKKVEKHHGEYTNVMVQMGYLECYVGGLWVYCSLNVLSCVTLFLTLLELFLRRKPLSTNQPSKVLVALSTVNLCLWI